VSVADKTGLIEFCRRLARANVEIVSSGGTAAALAEAGIAVRLVAEVTGSPEMFGGRVKTLHPRIHGAILARPDDPAHRDDLESHAIEPFQLVVVNLYPFREAAKAEMDESQVIEEIDIGGPALIRAAAKNHAYVGVVAAPHQYEEVAAEVEAGGLTSGSRRSLAAEAFFHTASYDAAVVSWMEKDNVLPERLVIPMRRREMLRYGENPHQLAASYVEDATLPWWASARLIQGKEMSFNNWIDTEAAWSLVNDFERPAAAVVKHSNPCGAAVGSSVAEALGRAWESDSPAAFGGVVAMNRPLDRATAEFLAGVFVEVVVVPQVNDGSPLTTKANLRLLEASPPHRADLDLRRLEDGFLAQTRDRSGAEDWNVVTSHQPTDQQWEDLLFAWVVASHTKSNAIALAKGLASVGIGAGDQSRVGGGGSL
jgi:phosphoribosylaminoimidazolecarboxamide formyltransferase/IMP cyclohydrolase